MVRAAACHYGELWVGILSMDKNGLSVVHGRNGANFFPWLKCVSAVSICGLLAPLSRRGHTDG